MVGCVSRARPFPDRDTWLKVSATSRAFPVFPAFLLFTILPEEVFDAPQRRACLCPGRFRVEEMMQEPVGVSFFIPASPS